jgi:hypothetical protein
VGILIVIIINIHGKRPKQMNNTATDRASLLYATILKHKLNCCCDTVLEEEQGSS